MALLFLDGFDKYGPANSNNTGVPGLLTAGEWTTLTAGGGTIVAGLSSPGQALQIGTSATLAKTLATNYSRLIGGVRFSSSLGSQFAIQFLDSGNTAQCTITLETTGVIHLRNGGTAGTDLSTGGSISANSTHYLEWDIAFSNSAAYTLYLDGVQLFTGTGDTTGSANNNANQVTFKTGASGTFKIDDVYIFDTSGSNNTAPLLTSPRVETTFPTADSSVQFAASALILGSSVACTTATSNMGGANRIVLRKFTPQVNCTINSIGLLPGGSSATVKTKGVIYSDSAGAPNTLLSSGTEVVGLTSGTIATLALVTPQNLTAGTSYWLGYIIDTTVVMDETDGNNLGYTAANTYASGAPGTAPSMTSGQPSVAVWGNCTSGAANYAEVNDGGSGANPPQGILSYVSDSTSGHEDLYTFGALSSTPGHVYAVAVKAYCERSDSGARTVSMRMKSNGTDSGGTNTGQTPATSFGWLNSIFELDPQAGTPAWSGSTLDAATSGFKIDS